MMESGKMIKRTAMENTFTPMEPTIKVNGGKICKTGLAYKLGSMEASFRDTIIKEKNRERANTSGKTEVIIKVIGKIIR
jgi:hypothetical protein